MGAPTKTLQPLSIRERVSALQIAQEAAGTFSDHRARTAVLELLREMLQPMTEWLDVSAEEWAKEHGKSPQGKMFRQRVLPFIGKFAPLGPIGLTREGVWLRLHANGRISPISSERLARLMKRVRREILRSSPTSFSNTAAVEIELLGEEFVAVTEHTAFLMCLASGLDRIDRMLRARESRLIAMRERLSFMEVFAKCADPLAHDENEGVRFPGYAVFQRTEHGTSRRTGTYLTEDVPKCQTHLWNDKTGLGYYVHDDSFYLKGGFVQLLVHLERIMSSVGEQGQSKREPISQKETAVLSKWFKSLLDLVRS